MTRFRCSHPDRKRRAYAEEEVHYTLMVIRELYRVERRGHKNWIVNVIDDVKVFVGAIGNFQDI